MKSGAAALAKVTRPRLSGSYPRKRLFALLDRARKRSVIWVSGPPGCGKTTLVSSYLDARKLSNLWYRADQGDADVATFFYYLGAAAARFGPRKRPLPVLAPEFLPGLAVFAQRYFEILGDRLKIPSVIVFDDFHKVPAGSAVHEAIREGIARLPRGICVVFMGRTEPAPEFARLRADQSMAVVGWEDLRLTPKEVRGIARRRWKGKAAAAVARRLQDRADGWAAGLILLLERERAEGPVGSHRLSRESAGEVFDYFAGEILGRADAETRSFLLKSAFLPRMTAATAERITGLSRAGQILSSLNRHNYFTERLHDAEPAYRYHSLFRKFLLSRAASDFPPKTIETIRRDSARILEESGQAEEAVALLRESGDWAGLGRVARARAPYLVAQGRGRTLAEWLSHIPADVLRKSPWLLYWKGVSLLPFSPVESRERFEEAFRAFRKKRDASGVFLSWAGVVDSIVYGPEGPKSLDPWLSMLGGLQGEFKRFPSQETAAKVTCATIKALALRRPSSFSGEEWAERALAVTRTAAEIPLKIEALVNLAYYRFHGGEFGKTELVLDSLREMVRKPGVSPLARLTLAWVEASHANITARYDHGLKVVSSGLALSAETGVRLMDYILMGHGALGYLHKGDLAAARRFLQKMAESLGGAKPWEAGFYHYLAAWEALDRGDAPQASLHSDLCLPLAENSGNPWALALAHLVRAFVLHESGENGKAASHLAAARKAGVGHGLRFVQFACALAKAFFSLRRGDDAAAAASLREGMRIGRENGYAGVYLWRPGFLENIAAKALEEGIEVRYAQDLVRRNGLVPDPDMQDVENWPWPLRVYTFGRFSLVRDGKTVESPRKVQQKPLLMLKALIALGGREVTEERMTDVLWPDADGDLAHQAFATTLRRLRQLLGDERAVSLREGRLTLDGRHCWVDAWAFERLLGQAERARAGGEGAGGDPVRLAEKAVGLYRGHFLPGKGSDSWVVSPRERLRSKFLRAIADLGLAFEAAGEWEKAIGCYEKGLEADDLAEELYQRLMISHRRLGRRAEAAAAYRRCARTLSANLKIEPSPSTTALYESLLSSPGRPA